MFFARKQRLAIDLGTSNTLIYIEGKGIALREPSIVARKIDTGEVVAYGQEAAELSGRTSDTYEIIHPLKDGVIAHFTLTKQLLAHFVRKALHRRISRPEVVITVPSNISHVEHRCVVSVLKDLGISRGMIVAGPLMGAIGAGLNIQEPKGKMVADFGGGTADIAVISYGELVQKKTLMAGSQEINDLIRSYIREEYQLIIGDETAEDLKRELGTAFYSDKYHQETKYITGQSLIDDLPQQRIILDKIVADAIDVVMRRMVKGIRAVLEETPPELAADIIETGLVLIGEGAYMRRLSERLEDDLKVPVRIASQPGDAVVKGAGQMISQMKGQVKEIEK